MTNATPDIKEKVRERYANIALTNTSCCGPDSSAVQLLDETSIDKASDMQFADYAALQNDVVEGSDLGLGCGTPTLAAQLQPGQTVLDLGSGAGIDVFLAAKTVGPAGRVIGIDMTPEMLALARENARKVGVENVEFRIGELENLPVDDDSIDVILSNCVINLVPDKAQVFREMRRVLKPGGRFSVSDIITSGVVPDEVRTDVALWTGCVAGAMDKAEYLELIRASGFENVRVEKETEHDAPWEGEFKIISATLVAEK